MAAVEAALTKEQTTPKVTTEEWREALEVGRRLLVQALRLVAQGLLDKDSQEETVTAVRTGMELVAVEQLALELEEITLVMVQVELV